MFDCCCRSPWNILDGLVVMVSLVDTFLHVVAPTKSHGLIILKVLPPTDSAHSAGGVDIDDIQTDFLYILLYQHLFSIDVPSSHNSGAVILCVQIYTLILNKNTCIFMLVCSRMINKSTRLKLALKAIVAQ